MRGAARSAVAALAASLALAAVGAAAADPPAVTRAIAPPDPDGRDVYVANCAACHQLEGEGLGGLFPPLAGSEWVAGDERAIVRIVLRGLTGEVEVKGQTYSGLMPPLAGALSDAEIAAVATYVRGSWGNSAAAVLEATVARERAATAGQDAPWTVAELVAGLEAVK